jgi:transposase
MQRQRFSEEHILRIVHEAETLDNGREVCRPHNSAEQTLSRGHRQSNRSPTKAGGLPCSSWTTDGSS